jgi:hypothetical protein
MSARFVVRVVARGLACTAVALITACAGPGGPAAWDKSFIAKPEMSMSWGMQSLRFDQHVYESKEAAMGGYGIGGGGCGCN